jgi:hypothetical protein
MEANPLHRAAVLKIAKNTASKIETGAELFKNASRF